jgi:transcriptional regulator GlxA family with amidase domain
MAKLPECVDVGDTPILGILQNIRRESANRRVFASDIVSMNSQEIYLHLQRASGREQSSADRDDLADVVEYIENNLDCDMNLQDLANIVCLEKTYFLKKFKQLTGLTPMAYTRNARIKKAKELLRYSDMNVTQIARAVGFRSVHHFSRYFAEVVGMSPSRYKESQQLE